MKNISIAVLFVISSLKGSTQGCSDAGFCSLGILKNDLPYIGKSVVSIGAGYGHGEQNTSFISGYLEYKFQLREKWSFQGKLTTAYASGFLGNNFNVGDIYATATYLAKNKPYRQIHLLGGVKIPLTTANDKYEGKPLPLDYQSSIGTYDFIAGASFTFNKKWELNTGLQIPVVQVNKNSFYPDEYADPKIESFVPTNNFSRQPDVLLRAGYIFETATNIRIKPNILGIYHLGNDTYQNRFGKRTTIQGSKGLTLNSAINATKMFTSGQQVELVLSAPFVVREVRADGLTRSFVVNVQYSFPL